MNHRWLTAIAVTVGLVATSACAGGGPPGPPVTGAEDRGSPVTFVAIGGPETSGSVLRDPLRTSWPHLLYRNTLPQRSVFVNLADDRAIVAEALTDELPRLADLDPTIVTLWFGPQDLREGTSLDDFTADFETLLTQAAATKARVLVLTSSTTVNGPDPGLERAYDAAMVAAAHRHHADVVALGSLADPAGEGAQQQVADAVERVLGPVR